VLSSIDVASYPLFRRGDMSGLLGLLKNYFGTIKF